MIAVAFWTCRGDRPRTGATAACSTVGLGLHEDGCCAVGDEGGCRPSPETACSSSGPARTLKAKRFMEDSNVRGD